MELRPHLLVEATVVAMRSLDAPEGYIYLREEYATARSGWSTRSTSSAPPASSTASRSSSWSAPARTSPARRRRCSSRWRGAARCRGSSRPSRASSATWDGPTLIQNVETLAHIPAIVRDGGEWWAGLGTRGAKGTRLWSVSGAVGKPGCYEAPNGITTRELVDEYAGGFSDEIGAVVPAAPRAGSCRPTRSTRRSRATASREYGAGPGSAAVQVFPASYSPLRLLSETMRFFAEESCQKCTPCRIGNRALHHLVRGARATARRR